MFLDLDNEDKKKLTIGVVFIVIALLISIINNIFFKKREVVTDPKEITTKLVSTFYEKEVYPAIEKPENYFEDLGSTLGFKLNDILSFYSIEKEDLYEGYTCNTDDAIVNVVALEPYKQTDYKILLEMECAANEENN